MEMIKNLYSAPLTSVALLEPGSMLASSYQDGGNVFDMTGPGGDIFDLKPIQ